MEPHERELLQEVLDLSQKNNKILHGMQKAARWSRFFKVIYWVGLIVILFWGTYYVQPYIDNLFEMYKTASTSLQEVQNSVKSVSNTIQGVQSLKK